MTNFSSALWIETLKMFRSKVPLFTAIGFSMMPLAGGLFMVILKDPEAAKSLGLITTKAQLLTGAADWPSLFSFLAQAVAAGGMILFSIITIWVFGREFSDHTIKELLALPTSRETIVTAKFIVLAIWSLVITILIFGVGLLVGNLVVIPGWSAELVRTSFVNIVGTAALTIPLMSLVALLASAGRGYLPPFGWTIFTLFLANLSVILGWGDWLPWAVPGLFSGVGGTREELLGVHSYVILTVASIIGFGATYLWWRDADQTQ
ncbi:MAG TPA: ABC transporter permease [Anaerolineales bacterium]|nr:ABC transporter permease [Anaerolineales bacterium]